MVKAKAQESAKERVAVEVDSARKQKAEGRRQKAEAK
jgi:hypothetical protein